MKEKVVVSTAGKQGTRREEIAGCVPFVSDCHARGLRIRPFELPLRTGRSIATQSNEITCDDVQNALSGWCVGELCRPLAQRGTVPLGSFRKQNEEADAEMPRCRVLVPPE